jgi:hypothetical protein
MCRINASTQVDKYVFPPEGAGGVMVTPPHKLGSTFKFKASAVLAVMRRELPETAMARKVKLDMRRRIRNAAHTVMFEMACSMQSSRQLGPSQPHQVASLC